MCDTSSYSFNNIKILSNQYNDLQIETAYKDIRSHFMQVFEKQDYLNFELETLKTILTSDDLNVDDEEIVLKTIKNWLNHKKLNPEKHLHLLLEVVRLPLLSIENLWTQIEEFINSDINCLSIFLEAIYYHLFPMKRYLISSRRSIERKMYRKLLAVGSWNVKTSGIFEIYDTSLNKWMHLKTYNFNKAFYATALINNNLMIMGGQSNSGIHNTVEIIDLFTGSISSAPPMKEKRCNFNAVVVKGISNVAIYVVGGYGSGPTNTVERWDPISREWSYVAPMSVSRDGCGCAYFDGKIYAAGGRNGNILHVSMEAYDIKTNIWDLKAPMANTRPYCRIVASDTHIYAVGGHGSSFSNTPLSSVEKYDPKTNSWTSVALLTSPGINGLWSFGKKIMNVGGSNNSKIVEEFDPEKNEWSNLAPLQFGREGAAIVEIPKEMFHCKFDWI